MFGLVFLAAPLLADPKGRPVSRAEIVPSLDTLTLSHPGIKGAIPYKKYGKFTNVGTRKYRYVIKDKTGLAKISGEGIYPSRDIFKDPTYRKLNKKGKLKGSHWDYVETRTAAKNFYKWATSRENAGIKQFYTAMALERAGLIEQAIKAYYAVVVFFPKTSSLTYYKTPWYPGVTSLDRVEQLLRRHPKIKMKLEGGRYNLKGIYDIETKNDEFSVNPGELVNVRKRKKLKSIKLKKRHVFKTVGGPQIQLKKYKNGHWQLQVDGKPFPVRAITYSVAPVGVSPDRGTWNPSKDWQLLDTNENGLHDGFFESFVDKNKNNRQDKDEPTVGDAQLLKDLGINTLRAYHHLYNKDLFRKLHKEYGFYVLAGDLLGGYATGSGASWEEGTDYTNPVHKQNMLDSVRSMVEEYKDEPYILMWVLGNENVYGVANNSNEKPEVFYEFLNEAAKMVKEIDSTRPVAIANGDLAHLDVFAEKCPDVDVFGINAYRGEQGFGRHVFKIVKELTDRPVLITEYGVSSIAEGYTPEEAEAYQGMYLANNWEDIEAHRAGRGEGVALGGVLFEYVDEWWKANSDLPEYVKKKKPKWYAEREHIYRTLQPETHDEVPQFGLPFLDGWSYEEWFGLMSLGDGEMSPFVRQPRSAYDTLKKLWAK